MGLFTKKPTNTSKTAPLYTIGGQKTILIVGLGNPGEDYTYTRHNAGFIALDHFKDMHAEFDNWINKKDLKCMFSSGNIGATRVILIKPNTFMNESGQSVQAVQNFYKISNSQMVVVHDELDIPFGQIRTRIGGSDAGHNGVKSLTNHCGSEFGRIRIGILNTHKDNTNAADFVLKTFNSEEKNKLNLMAKEAENILIETIYSGKLNTETRSYIV